ncbi:hypothetical protein GBAR_LOCUS11670 [Geodia barretti]|uniref:Uncharacterized protein n=1 Tax=Geodia barretti TaxID=519541 RepID=A0AA35RYR5_GEOBA|nr:hypothetical protein GBAR_LOCUS11670 [Geodia barretti]
MRNASTSTCSRWRRRQRWRRPRAGTLRQPLAKSLRRPRIKSLRWPRATTVLRAPHSLQARTNPTAHTAAAGKDIALNDGRASATAGPHTTAHGDCPALHLPRFGDGQIPPHPTALPRHPLAATPAVLAQGAKARIDGAATVTAGITVADGKADIARRYRFRGPARGAVVLPAARGAAAVIPAATAIALTALREGTYHPSHGG